MPMTLVQVGGAVLIFLLCPLLGGLPLCSWIVRGVAGVPLAQVGTGNVGVSAAFYHGGRTAGVLCVLAEAAKGIAAVLLARHYFPQEPVWELVALIALVMGRYWLGQGAGTTNVVWGYWVHAPVIAGLTLLLSLVSFTVVRERQLGRLVSLALLPVLTALLHPGDGARVLGAVVLSGLLAWIYQKLPDDLDLSPQEGRLESRRWFRFFRGENALISLDGTLDPQKVGPKAATLAQLRTWGYPVPRGYVLLAGDDPAPLLAIAEPSPAQPVVARSSALDEDTGTASAAGIYTSITDITDGETLARAIQRCFAAYNAPAAVRYRQDRQLPERGLAVIVQQQVGGQKAGQFSGVAFSRDPVSRDGDGVVIEALAGPASQVVSGQVTPEQYQVAVQPQDVPSLGELDGRWQQPEALELQVQGAGTVPKALLQQVAYLARQLEVRYRGVPQDIEWTYDGETLWLLQCRPITTLQPIWTRKIAAEVIPGAIRPLTWSINRPLTCGVWGEIFTLVLGQRAAGLDFEETATLHRSYAYFNATLLGEIFLRMGLPPESLEFLTRGAKFSRPPLASTLRNLPGLLRLLRREFSVTRDFQRDWRQHFAPALQQLETLPTAGMTPMQLLQRAEEILALLRRATYYSILAPLSLALRRGISGVDEAALDVSQSPEVAALQELRSQAQQLRSQLSAAELAAITTPAELLTTLERYPRPQAQLQQFLDRYGYLSEVGTDIAVPTWREDPAPVYSLLLQQLLTPVAPKAAPGPAPRRVQARADLRGQVTACYSRLLAELRWTFVALEQHWLKHQQLSEAGDIFFLTYEEVQDFAKYAGGPYPQRIAVRRQQHQQNQQVERVPPLAYGTPPETAWQALATAGTAQRLQGIGASAGIVEGRVRVLRQLVPQIEAGSILVVPYTDSGWAPLLSQAAGLIAEVGGRLSHGAIVAREYGIPAVMDIAEATQRLREGQRVRIDGARGVVEVLETSD